MAIIGIGISVPGLRAEFFQRHAEVNKATHWESLTTRLPSALRGLVLGRTRR